MAPVATAGRSTQSLVKGILIALGGQVPAGKGPRGTPREKEAQAKGKGKSKGKPPALGLQ